MNAPVADSRTRRPSVALAAPFSLAFLLAWLPPVTAQTAAPAAGASEPALATESSVRELTARIEELERRLGASALLDLVARIDRLKKEIQELRDHAEVQAHKIEALQGRQQDLYAELDRLAHRLAQPAPEVAGVLPETGETPGPAEESTDEAVAAVADPGSPADESGEPGGSRPAAADDAAPGGVSEPIRESPPQYDPVEEQAQYQLAFDLLSEGRFERAANAFTEVSCRVPGKPLSGHRKVLEGRMPLCAAEVRTCPRGVPGAGREPPRQLEDPGREAQDRVHPARARSFCGGGGRAAVARGGGAGFLRGETRPRSTRAPPVTRETRPQPRPR